MAAASLRSKAPRITRLSRRHFKWLAKRAFVKGWLRASLLLVLVVALLNGRGMTAEVDHAGLWWSADSDVAAALEEDLDCGLPAHRSHLHQVSLRDKREAVDLARSKLHILEMLDNQLREFASIPSAELESAPQPSSPPPLPHLSLANPSIVSGDSGQQICLLPLNFAHKNTTTADEQASKSQASGCLADPELGRQVPPYMLNLRRQLLDQAQSLAQAVHLMPYKSLVMRSFTQPQPVLPNWRLELGAQQDAGRALRPGLVVELSALGTEPGHEAAPEETELELELEMQELRGAQNKPHLPGLSGASGDDHEPPPAREKQRRTNKGACLLSRATEDEEQLCYWFEISQQLQMKINGSLVKSRESSSWKRERLVEAELHLYKLLPELVYTLQLSGKLAPPLLDQPQIGRRAAGAFDNQNANKQDARASAFHLKTNLLEVSLYQILPSRERAGPALRLLDIRRMDLHSSGWETFYVKRALEDWISDASSNLGLVIKAKSMLDEPIRVGLLRFAGLSAAESGDMIQMRALADQGYERKQSGSGPGPGSKPRPRPRSKETAVSSGRRRWRNHEPLHQTAGEPVESQLWEQRSEELRVSNSKQNRKQSEQSQQQPRALGFNLSHQPILVIYTTSAD